MTCCQRNELFAPAKEERVGCDKQRVGPALDRSGKRGINLSFVACVDDAELDAKRARRSASSVIRTSAAGNLGFTRTAMTALGTSSRTNSMRFCSREGVRKLTPVTLPCATLG